MRGRSQIVKLGYAGEDAKAIVANDEDSNAPSRTLLATYNIATPATSAARTPRTPAIRTLKWRTAGPPPPTRERWRPR